MYCTTPCLFYDPPPPMGSAGFHAGSFDGKKKNRPGDEDKMGLRLGTGEVACLWLGCRAALHHPCALDRVLGGAS